MRRTLLLAAALSACVPGWTQSDTLPARATLVTSTVVIACDFVVTTHSSATGWRGTVDYNPVLYKQGPGVVAAYGLVSLGLNAFIWWVTPPRYRAVYGGVVTGWEAAIQAYNASATGGRWCW